MKAFTKTYILGGETVENVVTQIFEDSTTITKVNKTYVVENDTQLSTSDYTTHDADNIALITDIPAVPNEWEPAKYKFVTNSESGNLEWATYEHYNIVQGFRTRKADVKDPQPYPSWTFDETTYVWQPPVSRPADSTTKDYDWDEDNQAWVER